MKKRHFLALIATLFITLGAFAQTGNTYSMVLTLADGTIITIGPNDLTKLDFVEGTLTAEGGTNITDLMNQMKALEAYIKESQTSIYALNNSVASSQIQIKDLQDNMSALQKDIANNKAELMKYTNDAVAANKAELQESINMLLAEIAKNKEVITNEYHKAIDDLQTTIRQNTANIETNTADIAGNKANIETNAAGIDKNKDAIIELVKKLRDAGIRI